MPADLTAVTAAVLHLSDFRPGAMSRISPLPAYSTANTQTHYPTPQDLAVMYDLPVGSNSIYPGQGQSIAIVGQSYVDLSLNSIERAFVRTATPSLQTVLLPGTGVEAISPDDALESEIDLEYASGLLNQAQIFLVHVGSDPNFNVFDALAFAIDQDIAPVVSISYGQCELLLSQADLAQGNAIFEQAASQGPDADCGVRGFRFDSVRCRGHLRHVHRG
jgi:subtilase family serine protease